MIGRRAALGLMAAGAASPAPAQEARAIHALVVGINAYRSDQLNGCVNDARLVLDALRPFAATVTPLIDAQASRAGFDAAWDTVTGRCRRGDLLWLHFSGHGSRMPERTPGSERDGMDDFLVFAPFHHREAPQEMLLDNELEQRLAALGRAGVSVMFVADCCHAGTLTRSVHPAARRLRNTRTMTGTYPVSALLTALSAAPPPPPSPPPSALTHVHLFAAGQETEEVPEILFRGRPHGAMSVAIATGLEGAADLDGDGTITVQELGTHVLRIVRGLAEARQTPEIEIGPAAPALIRQLRRSEAPAVAGNESVVRLAVDGVAPAAPAGALLVPLGSTAELLWRPATRELLNPLGDVIATEIGPDDLPAALERQRALRRVQEWVARHPLELRVELRAAAGTRSVPPRAHNAAHRRGTELRIVAEGLRYPGFLLFNLAGNATVQLLHPDGADRPVSPPGGRIVFDDIVVKPPFGADHVVALASARPLDTAAAAVVRLDGTRAPLAAVDAMMRGQGPEGWQVGLTGLFTRDG